MHFANLYSMKSNILTFAASVVFNPGFFFIHTDFVLVFTDALVGDIVVVAEWF